MSPDVCILKSRQKGPLEALRSVSGTAYVITYCGARLAFPPVQARKNLSCVRVQMARPPQSSAGQ